MSLAEVLSNKSTKEEGVEREFARAVAKTVEDAGFRVRHEAKYETSDFSFYTENGSRIVVECMALREHISERRIRIWVGELMRMRPPIKETLIVTRSIQANFQEIIDEYPDIKIVPYAGLRRWLGRYKPKPKPKPKPKRPTRTARIASTVKANKNQIFITTEALAIQIDDKLAKLKTENPNSDEAIAALKSEISDYEALKTQVEDLKKAVAKLSQSAASKEQTAKAAMSFGDGVKGWWNKQHVNILEKSAEMGVVLSAVGVCHLLGVSPNMAMAAATALVGGRSVARALKGALGH